MRTAIFTIFFLAIGKVLVAQGCSDAGFCTIGNLAHQSNASTAKQKHTLKLVLPTGLGDENVFVFTPGLEYGFEKNRWQFSGKVTGNYSSGNLGDAIGAGDLFVSATHQLQSKTDWKTSLTLGTKIPMNNGNLKENGLSLPMQYQSSLGTFDLILGVSVNNQRWKIAAGWQQPLTGINRNNFLPEYWRNSESLAYPPTNDFNRKGDVLLRSSYRLIRKTNWSLESGLLGIYHLGKDTYIDANKSNEPIAIEGSRGLTLNLTASLETTLSNRWSLGLVGGVPLVVREVRPDGLTRSFVLAPQITYKF